MEETIAAISTAPGVGAISIIRVSGEKAIETVNKIFKGKDLNKVNSGTINYGYIVDKNEIIDEVLVSIMRAPKTFTKEDIVEINCHGGIATTNKILQLLLENEIRLAEPGEFTKRAYLNGRIDLLQAESVMDIINAKTEKSRSLAINQLTGKINKKIKSVREFLVEIISNIEVNIDYPEYEDIEIMTKEKINDRISNISGDLKKILEDSENGKIVKEGIDVAIIGRPNVGKSSLLNQLLEEEKAIVTDIEGTTRDIVEGTINLDGIILNIIDTAGIRSTDDKVEKIGVEKSLNMINQADLILFILNKNDEITEEELKLMKEIEKKESIIIINKNDLDKKINADLIKNKDIIYMSALSGEGIEELKLKIKEKFNLDQIEQSDLTYLSSARSIALLKKAIEHIDNVKIGIKNDLPIDIIEIDLKDSWEILGQIIGENYDEELLDNLFSKFCVGK